VAAEPSARPRNQAGASRLLEEQDKPVHPDHVIQSVEDGPQKLPHLDPGRAVFYHPAGVVLFPLVAITGLALFLPARTRDRMARWAESRGRMLNWTGGILLALFLFYGLGRLLLLLLSGRPSPW